jgi:uncharacterized protein (TIGR00369 family)
MSIILDLLKQHVNGTLPEDARLPMSYPPPIAKTLGFKLVEIDAGKATIQLTTDVTKHANPLGTLHGGVIGDIADAAIGTAHSTLIEQGESFTSVDLRINFFRPVWNSTLRARAEVLQHGKTISYYECRVTDEKDRLMAVVTSSVMTLRGESAKGR